MQLATTVDQTIGIHSSGMPITQLTEVVTTVDHLMDTPEAEMNADERQWWSELLQDMHSVEVAIAELPPEQRRKVQVALESIECDVENWASLARQAAKEIGIEL